MNLFKEALPFAIALIILAVFTTICGFILFILLKKYCGDIEIINVYKEKDPKPLREKGIPLKVKGIPFYIRRARLIHEMCMLETLAKLALICKIFELDNQGNDSHIIWDYEGFKTVSQSDEISRNIGKLRSALSDVYKSSALASKIESLKTALGIFLEMENYNGKFPSYSLPLEKNALVENSYVDYDTTFYINKIQSLSGSSDLDIHLASDGTLSQASGQTVDSTFEKVIGAMPTGESLIGKSLTEKTVDSAAKVLPLQRPTKLDSKKKYRFDINFNYDCLYLRHIWFKEATDLSYPKLPLNKKDCWYRREIVTELATESKSPDKPETNKKKES